MKAILKQVQLKHLLHIIPSYVLYYASIASMSFFTTTSHILWGLPSGLFLVGFISRTMCMNEYDCAKLFFLISIHRLYFTNKKKEIFFYKTKRFILSFFLNGHVSALYVIIGRSDTTVFSSASIQIVTA